MEQGIYVDVLLVTNYIINLLLILCVGKLSGRTPKRRRIVAAALFGAATSLTIFLPFIPLLPSLLMKLAISAAIILISFPYISPGVFFKQLFLFFAVSFFFAGAMLGVWLVFSPKGMTYYNGVVYFDISSFLLIVTTVIAYGLLTVADRLTKARKLSQTIYQTTIYLDENAVSMGGLVDTGNRLREPFSNMPVIVCALEELAPLLPVEFAQAVREGRIFAPDLYAFPMRIRMIPYENVGGSGVIPAFKADFVTIATKAEKLRIEQVYIGVSAERIGDDRYSCLLNPDLISMEVPVKIH